MTKSRETKANSAKSPPKDRKQSTKCDLCNGELPKAAGTRKRCHIYCTKKGCDRKLCPKCYGLYNGSSACIDCLKKENHLKCSDDRCMQWQNSQEMVTCSNCLRLFCDNHLRHSNVPTDPAICEVCMWRCSDCGTGQKPGSSWGRYSACPNVQCFHCKNRFSCPRCHIVMYWMPTGRQEKFCRRCVVAVLTSNT
jgi:hypothetical protein